MFSPLSFIFLFLFLLRKNIPQNCFYMGMLQLLLLHPVRTSQMHLISSNAVTGCADSWNIDSKGKQQHKDNQKCSAHFPVCLERGMAIKGKTEHLHRVSKLLSASSGVLKPTISLTSRSLREKPPPQRNRIHFPSFCLWERVKQLPSGS